MKKYIALLLILLTVFTFSGCALMGGSSSSSSQAVPTAEPEVTEEPTDEPTDEPSAESSEAVSSQPQEEHTTSGELPQPEGSEEFIKAFYNNEIDKYYTENMNKATSVTDMVSVATSASQAWETLMNTTYDKVMEAIKTDADKIENLTKEQRAWVNDIDITISEIKAENDGAGSMAKVQVASKIMLMYRERCAKLLSELFEATGNMEITMATADAVG